VQAIKGSKDTLEVLSSKPHTVVPDEDLAGSTVCWFYLFSLASARAYHVPDRWCLFPMNFMALPIRFCNSCRICSWSAYGRGSPLTPPGPYLIYACASKSERDDI